MDELIAESILAEVTNYVNSEVSFIDAMIHYATLHDIEPEVLGEIIAKSQILKSKIQEDAEDLNLLEKTIRLPL